MKNTIMVLSLVTLISSCGKDNSTGSVTEVEGRDPISTRDIDSFVGVYDLFRNDTDDCGGSLQIVKVCDGVQARSSSLVNQSFCNVNKGEIKTGDNRSSTTVTFEENTLTSISKIFDERSTPPGEVKQIISHSLSFDNEGNLLKRSESKNGQSSCLYQKR